MNGHPYRAYKPSGVEWLGDVPERWKVLGCKFAYAIQLGKMLQNEPQSAADVKVPYLKALHVQWETVDTSEPPEMWASQQDVKKFAVRSGDLLICEGGEVGRAGMLEDAPDDCVIQNALHRVRAKASNEARYLMYLLEVAASGGWFDILCNKATIAHFTSEKFGAFPIALPPPSEQRTIAAYLDRETTRIDALIEKKQRQIRLLQEKRTALVHDATHNSSTRTMRIGHAADQIFRPIPRKDDDIYTPIGLYNWGRGIFHKEPTVGAELGDSNFFWLDADDLILSGQFAWEGAVALTSEKDKGYVATHRYPILRGKPGVMETAYLFAFFTTKTGDFLLNEHSRGAAGRNRPLNAGTLLKESIPVPLLETQSRVSAHVYFERRITPIIERAIQLLQEYRTSLISAAVTGKIDVRKEAS